jgi:hypothetical protein
MPQIETSMGNRHLLRSGKIPRLDRVKIYTAGHLLTGIIPAIPMGGVLFAYIPPR